MTAALAYAPDPQDSEGDSAHADRISPRDFEKLSRFIYDYSGIKMPPTKMTMLEGRLRRRLRATGIRSFGAYCDYLFNHDGLQAETVHLIDAVTTNKTDFFREPKHFEYLKDTVLPALAAKGVRRIRAWSAACSNGAEPYTLAMVLQDFVEDRGDMEYSILGTDLSTDVLQTALKGVYNAEWADPVPDDLRRRFVMDAVNPAQRKIRVHPLLRSRVGYARMNLMDERYPVGDPMDLIFCRNVLIYFDKKTQGHVLTQLCQRLKPGGHLFIGHSESITGLDLPVRQVANTIFQKT